MSRPAPVDERVQLGGRRHHVRRHGRSSDPPVLVLHGLMGNAWEWDTVAALLAEHHHVVALDQRGHGESDWADAYPLSGFAADAAECIEELGLAPAAVVGHSLGGMAGLALAATRPDLVDHLTVVDIGPRSLEADAVRGFGDFVRSLGSERHGSPDDVVAAWSAGNPLTRPELLAHWAVHALRRDGDGFVWRLDAAGLCSITSGGVTAAELWAAVDGVRCPTLLVRGEHSELVSPRDVAELADRLGPASSVVEIPGGGHDLGVEQPEAVAAAVLTAWRAGSAPRATTP